MAPKPALWPKGPAAVAARDGAACFCARMERQIA
jgi:hypothetical protein